MKIISSGLIALSLTLVLNSTSQAATKYKTTATAKTDFQVLDWNGGKVTVGTLKGILHTSGSDNASVPNGESVQNCLIRVVRTNENTDVSAHCTITDKDGDMLYATSERRQGDVTTGSSGKGRTRFIGGTGKYRGATGGCEYTSKYLPENWLVVESDCVRDY